MLPAISRISNPPVARLGVTIRFVQNRTLSQTDNARPVIVAARSQEQNSFLSRLALKKTQHEIALLRQSRKSACRAKLAAGDKIRDHADCLS
jgi:hypothetical protein